MTPLALVTAASGIGDVVRATPLVRVLRALGYDVDVLVAPDYLDTWTLLEGAEEIRRLYYTPSPWCREGGERTAGLEQERYDVATFSVLGAWLQQRVRTSVALTFDAAQWRREGDSACVAALAARLGWEERLPPPIVVPSGRSFDLAPGTVALHPGCKPGWGWKRWHGFPALAAQLPEVALVGTARDVGHDPTAYFHEPESWPGHARSYVGTLSLADTAALLGECAAVVAGDSGLMHVAAALGVPTLGIFGLTSPAREAMRLPNMHALSPGLPCEGACRLRPWGRSGCALDLKCLRTLEAHTVLERLHAILADAPLEEAHV